MSSPRAALRPLVPPPPSGPLSLSLKTWPREEPLHRIHRVSHAAAEFNPTRRGHARFSPLQLGDAVVPTLYAGSTFACAAMETVFHDVPFCAGLKTVDRASWDTLRHSVLRSAEPLQLIDLSAVALRKLGLRRSELIDTDADQYEATQRWAVALHAAAPHAHGLCWVSRQDDRARAMMLFGDRVPAAWLTPDAPSRSLGSDREIGRALDELADALGVLLVHGGAKPKRG